MSRGVGHLHESFCASPFIKSQVTLTRAPSSVVNIIPLPCPASAALPRCPRLLLLHVLLQRGLIGRLSLMLLGLRGRWPAIGLVGLLLEVSRVSGPGLSVCNSSARLVALRVLRRVVGVFNCNGWRVGDRLHLQTKKNNPTMMIGIDGGLKGGGGDYIPTFCWLP